MDKTELYRKLDIDTIEEFRYYENLAALLEEDDYEDPEAAEADIAEELEDDEIDEEEEE